MRITDPDSASIEKAVEVLRSGGLIGLPTETVYGLAARGDQASSVARIFEAKNRPATNPLILHVGSVPRARRLLADQLDSVTLQRFKRLSRLWPGPLTLIGDKADWIPDMVTAGGQTVAVRIPRHPVALELLGRCDFPVAAPSANVSNYISPTSAHHVAEGLGDRIEMVLDGGPCEVGLESTIVYLGNSKAPARVLRSGSITRETISERLGETLGAGTGPHTIAAPGQLKKHYSPSTPMTIRENSSTKSNKAFSQADVVPPSEDHPVLRIVLDNSEPDDEQYVHTILLSTDGNLDQVAARLYETLRAADHGQFGRIEIVPCEAIGVGEAIMDRVRRACS